MTDSIIIIVEPNSDQREHFRKILSKTAKVIAVVNGQEAIFEFGEQINQIQLMVINDQLSDMSVFTLISTIENNGYLVPNFILISKEINPDKIIQYMIDAGAYDVLSVHSEASVIQKTALNALEVWRKDMLQFRSGAERQNQWVFIDTVLVERNLKLDAENKFIFEQQGAGFNDCLRVPIKRPDFLCHASFAHGNHMNRKKYPLKLLLKELEDDTGEKATPPWRFKLLIIEDERSMREGLKSLLEEEYLIFMAETGQQGLDILNNHPDIDIVLTDIGLPDFNGTELIRESNKLNFAKSITQRNGSSPIFIALTAFFDMETIKEIARSGAMNYITKPFEPSDLKRKIRDAAEKKYYYKAISELLAILKEQPFSFRNRLFLADSNIKNSENRWGIKLVPNSLSFSPFFKEYCDNRVINISDQFPHISLETNLKEVILTIKENLKRLNHVDYIPLVSDCGFKNNITIPVISDQKYLASDELCRSLNAGILLVDDEVAFLSGLKAGLMHLTDKIYQADTGEKAIEMIKSNPEILIVITDMNLPDTKGSELIQAIRNCYQLGQRTFPPRFIMLTAYDLEAQDIHSEQLNIYKILSKGCDLSEIRNTIKEILSNEIHLRKVNR